MLGKLTAVAAASLTIGTLALPGTVFAHSNHVRANCNIGVNVEAHDYPAEPAGASASVTVEFDGQVYLQQSFGPAVKANAANPDKTIPHLYRVTFDRFDYVGPDGDKVYTGTIPACLSATTTSTPPSSIPADQRPPVTEPSPCQPGFVIAQTGSNGETGCIPELATDVPPVPSTTVAAFVCAGVMVADVCVAPTTTVAPPSQPSTPLPVTGNKTDIELAIALSALCIGWCMLRIRRSRA